MRTQEQELNYQKLELISLSTPQTCKSSGLRFLQRIWQQLLAVLPIANEIRIYEKFDRQGCPYWRIHDPRTGRSIHCTSEQEVRVWLEHYSRRI